MLPLFCENELLAPIVPTTTLLLIAAEEEITVDPEPDPEFEELMGTH